MINLSFAVYDVDDAVNALHNLSALTIEGSMLADGSGDDSRFESKLAIGRRIADRYREKFGVRIGISKSPSAPLSGLVVLHNTRPGANLRRDL